MSTGQSGTLQADFLELLDSLALGAGGGSPVDLDATLFIMLGIFLGLLWYLNRTLFQPYLAMSDARIERTDNARISAKEMQERSEEVLERYERQLTGARKAASETRTDARKSAKDHEAEILAAARTEINLTVGRARDELQAEVDAAAEEMKKQSEELSALIVERVLSL